MRTLASPRVGDDRIVSGESGAVTTGLVAELMKNSEFAEIKDAYQALVLDKDYLDKLRQTLFKSNSDTDCVAVLWSLGPVREPAPLDLAAVLYRIQPARILKQAVIEAAPLAAMEE